MSLPKAFIQRIKVVFKEEADSLLACLLQDPPTSIRLNPNRVSPQMGFGDSVPWHDKGYHLKTRPQFTFDPYFHAGHYYVQEASSMIIGHLANFLVRDHKINLALDLCAAPGGKSTLLLDTLSDGLLVSNELMPKRLNVLEDNMHKWGNPNIIITSDPSHNFAKLGPVFDLILVDAPCSGEGMFRKNSVAIDQWNPALNIHCAQRQKDILNDAARCLKPGGHLIYSTCTLAEEENMENVIWMEEDLGLTSISIPLKKEWNVFAFDGKSFGYHCLPHRTKGEVLFFSVLRKEEGKIKPVKHRQSKSLQFAEPSIKSISENLSEVSWRDRKFLFPKGEKETLNFLIDQLHVRSFGLPSNEDNRLNNPHHALALSGLVDAHYPSVSLDLDQAIAYLQGQVISMKLDRGWHLVKYEGACLGWAKSVGNRLNNSYPKRQRILKRSR